MTDTVLSAEELDDGKLATLLEDLEGESGSIETSVVLLRKLVTELLALRHSRASGVRAKPRLTDAAIRAACKAHFGTDNADGVSMTANDRDWNFREAFKRMWAGAWSELRSAASIQSCLVAEGVEKRAGIYVASKVAHAELWRDLRHFAREPIISTWIDEAGVGESASLEDLWRRCVHEASNAGALIIYRRPDEVLKGAWVELGAALAAGVPVFAVGIEEFTVANHKGITHCRDLIEARRRARESLSQAQGEGV